MAGLFASAEGTDSLCSLLAGSDDLAAVELGAVPIPPSAFIRLKAVVRGGHS